MMSEDIRSDDETVRNPNIPANTKNTYHVTSRDLPLSCPMPDMELWNSHPRVFLPIEDTGEARCPYCGAKFILADATILAP